MFMLGKDSLLKRIKIKLNNIKKIFHEKGLKEAFAHINEYIKWKIKKELKIIQELPEDRKLVLKTFEYSDEKIVFEENNNPLVSVIIPVYNQFEYTYCCLKAIKENTKGVSYEIIIADDNSSDKTKEIQKVAENIKVIRNSENKRFLLNCKNASKFAKGKYLLFLNNDTQVQQGWLDKLVEYMENHSDTGLIGSKLIYEDGILQEAGGILWNDGTACGYGNGNNPLLPQYNYVKETDYITGACILTRKDLWDEIGGFDERYVPAYYEDTDYAFEVRKKGFKVVYQPDSIVIHYEGRSNGTDISTGQKAYQVVNREKFYQKWKAELQDHFGKDNDFFLARDRSKNKKHILVLDNRIPQFDKNAGGKCSFMYIKLFCEMGFSVSFIPEDFNATDSYCTFLESMGVEVLAGIDFANNWKYWFSQNGKYFDYVFLQRPLVAKKFLDIIKNFTSAKIIYFAHDLHHIREFREYELSGNKNSLKNSKKWKKLEYDIIEKTDASYVVGTYEQEILSKSFPKKIIRNIPVYFYEVLPGSINKDFASRKDIMFVGGFNHAPNKDAVLWFAKEIFPKIIKCDSSIKWYVVGNNPPDEIKNLKSENIIITGFCPDDELEALYRNCRIAVVPLRYGAGVKGKVVESAYFQIPLVTTNIGAEGLDCSIGNMCVEDDPMKMAELICKLYEDFNKLKEMSDSGSAFIKRYFSQSEAEKILMNDFPL